MATKSVFISYAYEPEILKEKTHRLAEKLLKEGIPVVLDKYDLRIGNDIDRFMSEISNSEKYNYVLVICTSKYKAKADRLRGNVGKEATSIGKLINNNPFQEVVVPVIFEKTDDIAQILPNIFPRNTYWVDLSENDDFENANFRKLLDHLRGLHPFKPKKSQIEILSSYSETELPGAPDNVKGEVFQGFIRPIVQECISSIDSMLSAGIWFELSNQKVALEKLYEQMSKYDEHMPDVNLITTAYSTMWEYKRTREDHEEALKVIEKAILISEKDKFNPYYPVRRLELNYKKAYSLHMLNRMDEALPLYEELFTEGAKNLLQSVNPLIIFNSALFTGHIKKSKRHLNDANNLYRDIVLSIERTCQGDFPVDLFIDLRNIYYNALFHIENRTEIEEEKFKEYDALMDEPLLRYKTSCKELIPPAFGLPIVMTPDYKNLQVPVGLKSKPKPKIMIL